MARGRFLPEHLLERSDDGGFGPQIVQRARPDLTRGLHVYQEQIERIPLMGVDIVPLEIGVLIRSADVRRQYGLLVNDSLVVAAARERGIESLASADADFRRVKEMKLYRPGDLCFH